MGTDETIGSGYENFLGTQFLNLSLWRSSKERGKHPLFDREHPPPYNYAPIWCASDQRLHKPQLRVEALQFQT